jgi:uncharacterized DUF497 family protein
MVWIQFLLWDEWNEEQVARHHLSPAKVEEAVEGARSITRSRNGTYRAIEQTLGARYISVILAPRGGERFYIVTTREADDNERQLYRRR